MVVEIDRFVGTSVCKSKGSWMVIVLCVSTRLDHFDLKSCRPKNFSTFTFFYPALKKKKNVTGVWLIYSVMLFSAVQQSESAVCIHISPLFRSPSHLGHHRALNEVPCAVQ